MRAPGAEAEKPPYVVVAEVLERIFYDDSYLIPNKDREVLKVKAGELRDWQTRLTGTFKAHLWAAEQGIPTFNNGFDDLTIPPSDRALRSLYTEAAGVAKRHRFNPGLVEYRYPPVEKPGFSHGVSELTTQLILEDLGVLEPLPVTADQTTLNARLSQKVMSIDPEFVDEAFNMESNGPVRNSNNEEAIFDPSRRLFVLSRRNPGGLGKLVSVGAEFSYGSFSPRKIGVIMRIGEVDWENRSQVDDFRKVVGVPS